MSNNELVVGIDPHRNKCGAFFFCNNIPIKSITFLNRFKSQAIFLVSTAESLAKSHNCNKIVFVIESTNVFWRPLFCFLTSSGYSVFTVNSFQTHNLRKTNKRKTQTDKIDAKTVAQLYLNNKHNTTSLPSGDFFDLRELTRFHSWLTNFAGVFLNRLFGYLFQVFPEAKDVFGNNPKSATVFSLIKHNLLNPHELSKVNVNILATKLKDYSHGRFNLSMACRLSSAASNSLGLPIGHKAFSPIMKIIVELYEFIQSKLSIIEKENVYPIVNQYSNSLSSAKGFSKLQQASFLSEIGNPNNFKNANDILAWFGLDPSLRQSGNKSGYGKHISKAGTKYGRETMFHVSKSCILHTPVVRDKYKKLRKSGISDTEAKILIGASLVKCFWAMLRDHSNFDPKKFS
jgi:transposase